MPNCSQIEIPLERKNDVQKAIAEKLNLPLSAFYIDKLSLDSRRKGKPFWCCNIIVGDPPYALRNNFNTNLSKEVSIIGAGPAGLWAALGLLRAGHKVHLYEQGKPVEERFRDIRRFIKSGIFNQNSNILFGEGGAGTFSDGKLNTRTRNEYTRQVLDDLIKAGANEEIAYLAKPHIGTDQLQFLIKKIRAWILELGGQIHFESVLQNISVQSESGVHNCGGGQNEKSGILTAIKINNEWIPCESLVIACGHSARDLYAMLKSNGVKLEGKSFAIGTRIQHPQKFINETRLGYGVDYKLTGAADYTLAGKTAYSFCMCPGGVVVPCASEPKGVCSNGMSYSRRNSPFANSAIVTQVEIKASDTTGGIELQREIERKAFELGGQNYSLPKQTAEDFLKAKTSSDSPNNIWEILPKNICENLANGLIEFDKKIPNFIKHGTLIAPETRTSSPLRILRDENLESVSVKGIFPIGEGAGYAGGIITSAADGLKLA